MKKNNDVSEGQFNHFLQALGRVFKTLDGRRILLFSVLLLVLGMLIYAATVYVPFFRGEALRIECQQIDKLKSKGIIFTNPNFAEKNPKLYCACLSEAARRTSSNWMVVAIFIGLLGAVCVMFGGALGPLEGAKPGTLMAARGILFSGLGAILISFAVYANSRATAASNAAANAHTALTAPNEKKMYQACVVVKSSWISSRVESAAVLMDLLGHESEQQKKDGNLGGGDDSEPKKENGNAKGG